MGYLHLLLQAADQLKNGADPLTFLTKFSAELGVELDSVGVQPEDFGPAMKAALQTTVEEIEGEGY